jgi:CheY-like chemotaxis protein
LAEDEPIVRDLAVRIITRAGYSVLVAADGAEAVELFEANADVVSLALLDAVMPKLTGHQAYDRIKLKKVDLPVVFCSGYDPETGQVKLLVDDGMRILQKPFDPDVLLRTLREILDAQQPQGTSLCTA